MNLKSEEICAIDTAVREQITKLKNEVINEHSPLALISLLDLALFATRSLHNLWSEHRPRRLFSKNVENELEYRREGLRFFVSFRKDFPVMHSWSGYTNDQQERMICGLKCGPLENKWKRQANNMRQFIECVVMPAFAEIQHMVSEPKTAIEREVQQSPPLSYKNRKEWADLVVRWACWKWSAQMKIPGSGLWNLAKPENELRREKRKSAKRVGKWEKKQKSGIGELDCIQATKLQVRQQRLATKPITAAHIRNELKARIVAYLERNLTVAQSSP